MTNPNAELSFTAPSLEEAAHHVAAVVARWGWGARDRVWLVRSDDAGVHVRPDVAAGTPVTTALVGHHTPPGVDALIVTTEVLGGNDAGAGEMRRVILTVTRSGQVRGLACTPTDAGLDDVDVWREVALVAHTARCYLRGRYRGVVPDPVEVMRQRLVTWAIDAAVTTLASLHGGEDAEQATVARMMVELVEHIVGHPHADDPVVDFGQLVDVLCDGVATWDDVRELGISFDGVGGGGTLGHLGDEDIDVDWYDDGALAALVQPDADTLAGHLATARHLVDGAYRDRFDAAVCHLVAAGSPR